MPGPETCGLIFAIGYFIATVIALVRKPPNMAFVIAINVFCGWSFIGWIIAFVMSLHSQPRTQPV